jgi:hypothetical protein
MLRWGRHFSDFSAFLAFKWAIQLTLVKRCRVRGALDPWVGQLDGVGAVDKVRREVTPAPKRLVERDVEGGVDPVVDVCGRARVVSHVLRAKARAGARASARVGARAGARKSLTDRHVALVPLERVFVEI